MAKVVNLNKVRKHKARAAAAEQAVQNRVKFGRTKAQKAHDQAQVAADRAKLDALKLEKSEDDGAL